MANAANSAITTWLGPVVSFRTAKGSSEPVHVLVPSTGTFTAAGPVTLSGAVTASSALTASGGFAVGAAGTRFASIVASTISVSPGAVAAADSMSTTATINALTSDAVILAANPASAWSGAYFDLAITAHVSAASTLRIGICNSTHTSVTPDAMNWTVVWADPS